MNPGIKKLIDTHLGNGVIIDEQSFSFGAYALKKELETFITKTLEGERTSEFNRGQDDGLRWVLDHLQFIFDKGF